MIFLSFFWAQSLAPNFLNQPIWDDGQAEVVFYWVQRTHNQYGQKQDQSFLVGTYLVKHDFDPSTQSKAAGQALNAVPAFKYALFYELESGSYQYKRNYVLNLAKADLAPLKLSFTCFDWCSNTYRELNWTNPLQAELLFRSDDYGNDQKRLQLSKPAVPTLGLTFFLRALDFEKLDQHEFTVMDPLGETTTVTARWGGSVQLMIHDQAIPVDFIELRYAGQIASPIGEKNELRETVFLSKQPDRVLVKWQAADQRYSMEMLEHMRSAYWRENLYEKAQVIASRP
ncbi:MAG: hypothetical protein H6510_06230 [Acidobacteria bacterium]|nr:hypothetical protein [Acidobacteriota bacterium]MCB9397392.1 hypothetical protein [Acidobacteriota bacterium]